MQCVISTFHLSAFAGLCSHTTTCCLRKESTISSPEILLPGKDLVVNGLSDQSIACRWVQRRDDGFVFAAYPLLGGNPSGNHLGKSLIDSRAAFEVGTPHPSKSYTFLARERFDLNNLTQWTRCEPIVQPKFSKTYEQSADHRGSRSHPNVLLSFDQRGDDAERCCVQGGSRDRRELAKIRSVA